jgi:phage baseplate assembly protein W
MTWSLKLTADGDLALGSHGFAEVANEEKLIQDLRCELLEPKGLNPLNPQYGSNLEGELSSDFMTTDNELMTRIEADIMEVIKSYQDRQLARAKYDKMVRGSATLTPKEVVVAAQISNFVPNQTSVNVTVDITTASSSPTQYPVQLNLTI